MINLKPVLGYDNNGVLFEDNDFIIRKVHDDYFDEAKKIFEFYQNFEFKNDIIETQIDVENKCFKHKKLTRIYPYEWTLNMFKDALLFYLELFLKLDKHGYTLKDGLPSNVMFDNTKPVFVDFLSVVKTENLQKESWLFEGKNYKDARYAVFDRMFTPFIIIPFLAMAQGKCELAREMLLKKACNMNNGIPEWTDLDIKKPKFRLKNLFKKKKKDAFWELKKFLEDKEDYDFTEFCKKLIKQIKTFDVTPQGSDYEDYYKAKGEDFDINDTSNWKEKQLSVLKALKETKPQTVLDLGANTGWYSLLAQSLGANVFAAEIDESCVDNLYRYAKEKSLNVLPLKFNFTELEDEYFGMDCSCEKGYETRDFKNNPLFEASIKRLPADDVMCLALAHHLVLGLGIELDKLMELLFKLSKKALIIEFIGFDDKLIQNEPEFFPSIAKFNQENYNYERFVEAGKKYFSEYEVLPSHPDTRKIIVFKK